MPRSTRRDAKPEPFWRALITRWKASGQSAARFCSTQGVSQASFYAWRQKLIARNSEPPTARSPAPAFAAVRIVPDPTAEIVLPSGLVGRVPVGADPAAVARLVTALGG